MLRQHLRSLLIVGLIALNLASTQATTSWAEPTAPRSIIHRQGEYMVRQLVTPEFERLPLQRRIFAYYLSRAIDMGRDIAWAQGSRQGLELRALLEDMWQYSSYFTPRQKATLLEYFFKVLANHGNYDKTGNQKILPEGLSRREFFAMAQLADSAAVNSGQHQENPLQIASRARQLARLIFDRNYFPQLRAHGEGVDPVAQSAANYYGPGVTTAMLDQLPEDERDHFLSYPIIGEGGTLVLQRHRIGDRFDEELRLVDFFLSKAALYGNDQERAIIEAHRKAIRTGDPQDVIAAETLWVQYKPQDFDFIMGFIETYGDPRNTRGAWEGFILMLNQDPKTVDRINAIRSNADYFEEQMPVDARFKKEPGFTPPQAEGAYILYTGGDNGERPFAGVNLPNYREIHERYGSKSYTALNVMHDIGSNHSPAGNRELELFYAPEYLEDLKAVDDRLASDIQVEFHEILGHGSGRNLPGVSETALDRYYNPLEEARAETASLFHILDLKVRDFGILPSTFTDAEAQRFARVMILRFFTRQIHSYSRLPESATSIRQAHQWGRQVMFNKLLASGGLSIRMSTPTDGTPGVPLVMLGDMGVIRRTLGAIWAEIQEAKSTGNIEIARNLFETWGVYTDEHRTWRHSVGLARTALHLPKENVYLNPMFSVVRDSSGDIADVQLAYEYAHESIGLERFINRQQRLRIAKKEAIAECASHLNPKR
jgi:dipeptidyl-peptidase-3